MKTTRHAIGVLAATLWLAATGVQALEPFAVYDRFDEKPLDAKRWVETERSRLVRHGGLHLMQRTPGVAAGDAGLTFSNWNANMPASLPVTALRARIRVDAVEPATCAANVSPGQARARIIGSFFNVGTAVPGSQVGDVIAQVRITRFSNTSDAPGLLRIQGIASLCTSDDCAFTQTIGNVVDLGTVAVGTPAVVQLQWDAAGNAFFFSRDGGAQAGSVGYAYSDAQPPTQPFHQLSTRLDLPNCSSGPIASGMVDARFDNVAVNRSALP